MSMIVSTAQKAIVLNPVNPGMLCNLLPMAKPFQFRGHTLYAVPHDIDVVRLLRNVGVQAPSPILHHYDWPGRFKPFTAQRTTAEFLTLNPRAFVLNDMGTGKTMSSLWAFDYLRRVGRRKRMLVVAPLSTLERVWADTIFTNFPHLTFTVLHGERDRRLKLLKTDFDVYIINHDGVNIIEKELRGRDDIDMILIDEVSIFRNSSTDRYKSMQKITAPANRGVWVMTGTPIPNEPTDAWAQIRLVDETKVPKYFGRFRDMVMSKITAFKWVARKDALDTVYRVMQPSVRFQRKDCVDLPDTLYSMRHVEMSPQQKRMYEDLRLRLKNDSEEGTVRAVNEADKMMKLVQVASGAVYNTDKDTITIDNPARLAELIDIIEQSAGKVIVFVPFTGALHNLREAIAAKGYATEMVYGGTSKADRDAAFWRFCNLPFEESGVLVANARAMSHGLTLTEANTVVWWAPTTSHETFDQANHRVIRPGQERMTYIIKLEGCDAERRIYKRLEQRQSMQGVFLEMFNNDD